MFRQLLKRALKYQGLPETEEVRRLVEGARNDTWPYCPADEGDLLYVLSKGKTAARNLEVGFATGSSALYLLCGASEGSTTSIDYAPEHHENSGAQLVRSSGLSTRHQLINENSMFALPRLLQDLKRFDVIFLDGWKTFDHLCVDAFYCARLLNDGGFLVFDDARMQSVRKVAAVLETHYRFRRINTYTLVGGWRLRVWHLLTTHSVLPPYIALQRSTKEDLWPAKHDWDFWRSF